MTRRVLTGAAVIATLAIALPGAAMAAGSGGVTGPAIYVDGTLYRTVGTPTDLSGTGAPDSSFQTIYDFGGLQSNVADAAPGDPGFRGGRWQVRPVSFADYAAAVGAYDANGSGNLDSDEEILAAVQGGAATIGGVVKSFECPLIPVPGSHA
jgi:hypothetical protein